MKLTYRAVSLDDLSATLEVTEGEIRGQYRGRSRGRHAATHRIERSEVESVLLHYRGGWYSIIQPSIAMLSKKQEVAASTCPVQFPKLSQAMSRDVHQVHVENMRRNLERRIQTAQAKGDQRLVTLLQQESNALRSV